MSIAGRRSANKGRSLFLTGDFFYAWGCRSPRLSTCSVDGSCFSLPVARFCPARVASSPRLCAVMTGDQVKSPQDDAFLRGRSMQKVH